MTAVRRRSPLLFRAVHLGITIVVWTPVVAGVAFLLALANRAAEAADFAAAIRYAAAGYGAVPVEQVVGHLVTVACIVPEYGSPRAAGASIGIAAGQLPLAPVLEAQVGLILHGASRTTYRELPRATFDPGGPQGICMGVAALGFAIDAAGEITLIAAGAGPVRPNAPH